MSLKDQIIHINKENKLEIIKVISRSRKKVDIELKPKLIDITLTD